MSARTEAEWLRCTEDLAAAAWRLMQLAGGAEVERGNVVFRCKDGLFSEEIAQARIRALLKPPSGKE